jgi:hypothetical protein
MIMVEAVLTWMLLRRRKVEKEASGINEINEQAVKEIYTAPSGRALSEPSFEPLSVTDHTTRTLEHTPKVNG